MAIMFPHHEGLLYGEVEETDAYICSRRKGNECKCVSGKTQMSDDHIIHFHIPYLDSLSTTIGVLERVPCLLEAYTSLCIMRISRSLWLTG
jgi:hypothetical protein